MFSKIILILILFFPSEVILVDKILAVVNNEIITLTDLDKSILLYPVFRNKDESLKQFHDRILQDLINYKVIFLEYRKDFILTEEDFEEVQIPIIKKTGSLDKLMELLKDFNMEWKDFKNFITEKVIYEKVLKEKFKMKSPISFQDIKTFYQEEYLPIQKQLDLEQKSLIEMTPLIENHLRKIKTEKILTNWLKEIKTIYKIENKYIEEK